MIQYVSFVKANGKVDVKYKFQSCYTREKTTFSRKGFCVLKVNNEKIASLL